MGVLVPVALFGWIPAVLVLFTLMPARKAAAAAMVAGWLFLPLAGYNLPGMPPFTKMTATCVGVGLATLIFQPGLLMAFRPSVWDLPMAVWCVVPMASSLTNGLGPYDGFSASFAYVVDWGLPYFLGRVYFSDAVGLRTLAVAIFVGGLIYVPLCLFEVRFSPQLHKMLYGYYPAAFGMTKRFGGFRPTVFMSHGLMVGLWMGAATVMGFWLWVTKGMRQIWGVPISWLVVVLLATTVLCKSFGALSITLFALAALGLHRWMNLRLVLALLIIAPMLYMATRTTGVWDGQELMDLSRTLGNEQRAGSLGVRLRNENVMVAKALEQPVFGWGGWNRQRVQVDGMRSVTDGFWIIAFGQRGFVGLWAIFGAMFIPLAAITASRARADWRNPLVAPGIGLATIVVMFAIDCLFNGMINPVYLVATGAATGLLARRVETLRPQPISRPFSVNPLPPPRGPAPLMERPRPQPDGLR